MVAFTSVRVMIEVLCVASRRVNALRIDIPLRQVVSGYAG
jgi:hypothetical protein